MKTLSLENSIIHINKLKIIYSSLVLLDMIPVKPNINHLKNDLNILMVIYTYIYTGFRCYN